MYNIFAKEEDQLVHSVNVIPPTSPPGPLSLQPTQLIPYSLPLIIFNIYTEQYTHSSKYFRKFQCKYLSTAVRRSYQLGPGGLSVFVWFSRFHPHSISRNTTSLPIYHEAPRDKLMHLWPRMSMLTSRIEAGLTKKPSASSQIRALSASHTLSVAGCGL